MVKIKYPLHVTNSFKYIENQLAEAKSRKTILEERIADLEKTEKLVEKLASAPPNTKDLGDGKVSWDGQTFNVQLTGFEIEKLILSLQVKQDYENKYWHK